jgi:hypothetical protein
MRYQETGGLHLNCHGATNNTIDYVADKYRVKARREIFFKAGRDVYNDILECPPPG